MFSPAKYLEKAAANLREAIEDGIVSHNADGCVDELERSKQYYEEDLKSGDTLSLCTLHRWFRHLESISRAFTNRVIFNDVKDPRKESVNIIRGLLDKFPILYYIECYTKIDLPIDLLVTTYKHLCNHITDRIADIVRCEDPLLVVEMRCNAISIIAMTNTVFSEHIRSAVYDYAHDVNDSICNILSSIDVTMNTATEDASDYKMSPERAKFLHDLIANNSFAGGINGSRGATPDDNHLKMREEYQFNDKANDVKKRYVGDVVRSSESKLSDLQGGCAPISSKISDKD